MSEIARRLSVPEVSQQILDMAQTGVYRASVFEALQPIATQKQIRTAIAHAKRFGLHSVASLRDAELGTYYQVDVVKYQACRHLLHSPAHFGEDAELIDRVTVATQSVQRMLKIARNLAGAFAVLGVLGWLMGQEFLSAGLLSGAVSIAGVWAWQRSIVKQIQPDREL